MKKEPPSSLDSMVRRGSLADPHLIRFDGVSAGILTTSNGGNRVVVCVFGSWHELRNGDYVIFERQSGETTQYQINTVKTPSDPGDQHFLDCTFAPRSEPKDA